MISEFLLKGIDNIFQDKLAASRPQTKSIFTRQAIKRDLSTVIRTKDATAVSPAKKSNIQKNIRDIQQEFGTSVTANDEPEISKSRLKAYLENDRESKLKSVIRRADNKSKSPIRSVNTGYQENIVVTPPPYDPQRYSMTNNMCPPQYQRYQQPPPSQYLQPPQMPSPHQPHHQQSQLYGQPEQNIASKYYQGPPRRSMNPMNYTPSNNYEMRMSPSPNRVTRSPYNYRMF